MADNEYTLEQRKFYRHVVLRILKRYATLGDNKRYLRLETALQENRIYLVDGLLRIKPAPLLTDRSDQDTESNATTGGFDEDEDEDVDMHDALDGIMNGTHADPTLTKDSARTSEQWNSAASEDSESSTVKGRSTPKPLQPEPTQADPSPPEPPHVEPPKAEPPKAEPPKVEKFETPQTEPPPVNQGVVTKPESKLFMPGDPVFRFNRNDPEPVPSDSSSDEEMSDGEIYGPGRSRHNSVPFRGGFPNTIHANNGPASSNKASAEQAAFVPTHTSQIEIHNSPNDRLDEKAKGLLMATFGNLTLRFTTGVAFRDRNWNAIDSSAKEEFLQISRERDWSKCIDDKALKERIHKSKIPLTAVQANVSAALRCGFSAVLMSDYDCGQDWAYLLPILDRVLTNTRRKTPAGQTKYRKFPRVLILHTEREISQRSMLQQLKLLGLPIDVAILKAPNSWEHMGSFRTAFDIVISRFDEFIKHIQIGSPAFDWSHLEILVLDQNPMPFNDDPDYMINFLMSPTEGVIGKQARTFQMINYTSAPPQSTPQHFGFLCRHFIRTPVVVGVLVIPAKDEGRHNQPRISDGLGENRKPRGGANGQQSRGGKFVSKARGGADTYRPSQGISQEYNPQRGIARMNLG